PPWAPRRWFQGGVLVPAGRSDRGPAVPVPLAWETSPAVPERPSSRRVRPTQRLGSAPTDEGPPRRPPPRPATPPPPRAGFVAHARPPADGAPLASVPSRRPPRRREARIRTEAV